MRIERGDGAQDGAGRPGTEWSCHGVPADPRRLPALRRDLAAWAGHVGLAAEQTEALVLASYEALANAAVHAYDNGGGVLDVHAAYRPTAARVEVTVVDYGRWREPPAHRDREGGRGLMLIDKLAEHAEITVTPAGTSVRMTWTVPESQVDPGTWGST